MIETYQMRLARQKREQEEAKRRSRTTRGYGNDFAAAEAVQADYAPSSSDSCSDTSSPSFSCD